MDSTLCAIMKKTIECLDEIKKTKASVRKGSSSKINECATDCSKKWKEMKYTLNFMKNNQSKIESLLKGNRDICPPDIGKTNHK